MHLLAFSCVSADSQAYTTTGVYTLANQVAGFIFDFDGVVADSLSAHLRAWDAAMSAIFGQTIQNPARLIGQSTVRIAMILATEAGAPEKAPALVQLKRKSLENDPHKVGLLPGVRELFKAISDHALPWGIASNANRAFIEKTLANHAVHVPLVVAVEDVKNPKPAPDIFLLCAQKLNIGPTRHPQTIVFEDSVHGIHAAVKAGMFPIGVMTQHGSDELTKAGAQKVCRTLADITGQFKPGSPGSGLL